MDPRAVALILFSAVCHAIWNYLSHHSKRPLVAMWLMTATGLLLCTPLFLVTSRSLVLSRQLIVLVIASGLAKAAYYVSLAVTYKHSDLSVGYPLSRSGIVLVPVWAYLFLGEKISPLAGGSIVVIMVGIYVLNMGPLELSNLRPSAQSFGLGLWAALSTALLISVYSVIDKAAMDTPEMTAINFLFLMFIPTWLGMTPYVLKTNRWADIKQHLSANLARVPVMGLCDFAGYGAVLAAMEISKISHILALRQISVVLGAIMGAWLLREKYGASRILGAAIIFIGAFLVSISK